MEERAARLDPTLARVIAGRYRIDALIGSGSTGDVFRATRLDSGAVVAIKLLHAHLSAERHATLRFRREGKVVAAVDHPNLVKGIELGQDQDGTWFFAMELLVGRTLAVVMRDDQPLPFARIHQLLRQTLQALEAAHARGLVHRDLKPGNIIVVDDGGGETAKVCDFGMSKLTEARPAGGDDTLHAQATADGAICGTPAYMSPEQARGLPVDARTDLYAATVMLFEMVTGQLPFSGGTKMDILAAHLTKLPPSIASLRPDLPAGLEEVVRRGLAKRRESRYESAGEMRQALDAVFAGRWAPQPETVVMAPAVLAPKTSHALTRGRLPWLVMIAAALALTGGSWRRWHRPTARVAPAAPGASHAPSPPPVAAAIAPPAVPLGADRAFRPAAPPASRPAPISARRRRRTARAPSPAVPAVAPPSPSAALVDEAEGLMGEGRGKEACLRGEEALRLDPAAPGALRFLGRCYMRTGRRAEGLASYRRYLEVAPDAPDAPLIRTIVP